MHLKKKKGVQRVFAGMLAMATAFTMQPHMLGGVHIVQANTTAKIASTISTKNANKFSWDNANVYFLLTDRFNNGDKSNDHAYNRGLDQNGNVLNYNDKGATFHGGDFKGITDKINEGYFTDLGVNALWISAPYEQIHGYVIGGDGSESYAHYSYHGYYVLDYTDTDKNFGTAEEFKTLVDTAHKHGIRIVMDIVMNHSGYNTIYDMNEYGFGTLKSGWQDAYFRTSGINNSTYHGVIDYESSSTDWSKWWGTNWVRSGLPGYTQGGSSNQLMNPSGLPDFKTESTSTVSIPTFLKNKWTKEGRYNEEVSKLNSYLSSHNMSMTVRNCITYWLQSWVREYGVDGFRCDTAKHVEYASWKTLKNACVEALDDWKSKNPDKALDDSKFWMTGEVWDHGVYKDDYYTQGGFDSIINFSTQGAGLLSKNRVAGTYQGFADSINSDPDFNVLSYISSHDSVLTRGNSIYNGSAFLLCPGAVQIYYGDESDRPYDNTAAANGQHNLRSDMNWDSMNQETLAHWQKVGTFRNNHIAVGAGQNAALETNDGVAFSRTYTNTAKDISDKIAACIGCTSNTDVTIDVSSLWADGQYLVNAYDYSCAVVTNGKVTFNSGANGTILIEEPDGMPLASVVGNSEFRGTQSVTLSLSGADYAKVSVDGAKKFIAHDGDSFTIGETAYPGDVVKVQVEATNEHGTRTATFSFNKLEEEIIPTSEVPTPTPSQTVTPSSEPSLSPSPVVSDEPVLVEDTVYVKADFVPYVYAWKGSSTALAGSWPGTKMTQTENGYYKLSLGTYDDYNVVINNGSGSQTKDITGLQGGTWITVKSNMSYTIDKQVKSEIPASSKDVLYVEAAEAPYVYAWKGSSTALAGSWPGTKMSEKNAEGYYVLDLNSTDDYNVVLHNGSGKQTKDITGLKAGTWIKLNSDMSYTVVKTGGSSTDPTPAVSTSPVTPSPSASATVQGTGKHTFTFKVASSTGAAPTIYIWDDTKCYTNAFPGTKMTEKDGDYYVMTLKSDSTALNCIVSYGNSSTQSSDITGITGTVTITNEGSTFKDCKVEKSAPVESNYSKLKATTRSIKNLTAENFTTESYNAVYAFVSEADALIALGEDNADKASIDALLAKEKAAIASLQLAKPVVNTIRSGATTISGTAAYGSTVTVTVNDKTYTAVADDITGTWSVSVSSVRTGNTVKVACTLDAYLSNNITLTV